MRYIPTSADEGKVPVGSKIKFRREVQRYTVQASNACFSICTKPFNARQTVLYTVIDWKERIRGTENLVFCAGAETKEDCENMLERLTQGDTNISYRNRVPLDIEDCVVLPVEDAGMGGLVAGEAAGAEGVRQ